MSATSRTGLKQDYGRRRRSTPDWLLQGNRSWRRPGSLAGRHPRIVALGGGTGLPILLRGLKAALFPPPRTWVPERDRECLTAVVTAADDEGSELLRIQGRVLPTTLEQVTLRATFVDGSEAEGESRIALARRLIHRLVLQPEGAAILPEAREAIEGADLVVIGPGSLYTSLIAPLLLEDLVEAIARSRACVMLVMNLMTEPGETDGYTGVDHVLAIRRHAPGVLFDAVLLNTAPVPQDVIESHAAQGACPVPSDDELLRALGCRLLERDLLAAGPMIRHDPDKLARAVLDLYAEAWT